MVPRLEGPLAKTGVETNGIATTPLSGQPDLFGGTTPEFDALGQASVEDIYAKFTGHVAAIRKLPIARVREIAEGRVWSGGAARQLGLVDAFGGLDDAIAAAAKLAKLDPAKVHPVYYEPQPDAFAEALSAWFSGSEEAAPRGTLATIEAQRRVAIARAGGDFARLMTTGGSVQVDCLECRGYTVGAAPRANAGLWARIVAAMIG